MNDSHLCALRDTAASRANLQATPRAAGVQCNGASAKPTVHFSMPFARRASTAGRRAQRAGRCVPTSAFTRAPRLRESRDFGRASAAGPTSMPSVPHAAAVARACRLLARPRRAAHHRCRRRGRGHVALSLSTRVQGRDGPHADSYASAERRKRLSDRASRRQRRSRMRSTPRASTRARVSTARRAAARHATEALSRRRPRRRDAVLQSARARWARFSSPQASAESAHCCSATIPRTSCATSKSVFRTRSGSPGAPTSSAGSPASSSSSMRRVSGRSAARHSRHGLRAARVASAARRAGRGNRDVFRARAPDRHAAGPRVPWLARARPTRSRSPFRAIASCGPTAASRVIAGASSVSARCSSASAAADRSRFV